MRITEPQRLLAAASAVVLTTSVVMASGASGAEAATAPASCGNAVIVSMPLIDTATGQSSWNWGYVQLWYDYCNGDNWARVVSLLSGTSYERAIVYNTAGKYNGYACTTGTVDVSGTIYSPVDNAGAMGDVTANGVQYYAVSDQSGASPSDIPDGLSNC